MGVPEAAPFDGSVEIYSSNFAKDSIPVTNVETQKYGRSNLHNVLEEFKSYVGSEDFDEEKYFPADSGIRVKEHLISTLGGIQSSLAGQNALSEDMVSVARIALFHSKEVHTKLLEELEEKIVNSDHVDASDRAALDQTLDIHSDRDYEFSSLHKTFVAEKWLNTKLSESVIDTIAPDQKSHLHKPE